LKKVTSEVRQKFSITDSKTDDYDLCIYALLWSGQSTVIIVHR